MEDNKYNIDLGKTILKLRRRLKVTYYKVWKDIGLPINTIKRLEQGKGTVTNYQKLLDYLYKEQEEIDPSLFNGIVNWIELQDFSDIQSEEEEEQEQTN